MKRLSVMLIGLYLGHLLCAQPNEIIRIKPRSEWARPFPDASVVLEPSWIKYREDLNTTYLKSLDPERLLHNFRVNAGLPSEAQPLEGWEAPYIGLRGHFVGHYLSAVSNLVKRYADPQLAQRLHNLVSELEKCQQALGGEYLGAFPESDFDTLETRFGGVWAPYYTYQKIMKGLLDVYVQTGNTKAYDMVLRMATYVEKRMSRLDEAAIEQMLYTVGANPANEPGAMNEVLYQLYKISQDPKHLQLAQIFDRDWLLMPLARDENILSGLHANTHLVMLNGFARRYSVTEDSLYAAATVNFWRMLQAHHVYVNGSSSGPRPIAVTPTSQKAEHWGVPGRLSNTLTTEIAESCVTHNTQKLTSELFTWSAAPLLADVYMNTFYNAVLPSQNAKTGACVYHLPLGSPRKKSFLGENDFRCCNGSGIEAFSSLHAGIYYHHDSSLWVNLYIPSRVSWQERGVELAQSGDFPRSSSVLFTISAKRKASFALHLLIPSWAEKVEVFVNDIRQHIQTQPNSFISLNREWQNGDKIRLAFGYDFYIKTMPDDEDVVAIFYGPVLLAFEHHAELVLKGDKQALLNGLSVEYKDGTPFFQLVNQGKKYVLRPFFEIENQTYGVYATIRNY